LTDETRARFLAAIARQISAERVIELHLFPAIRQGGIESGVAVVTVERALPAETPFAVDDADVIPDARPSRYTVYSARYRLTLKGIDRGKWEVNVTEEADAPLITIDAVVRGVHRRSGDADETIRLSGDEFRAGLPKPVSAA
jgi:hypothetical protein